MTKAGGKRGLRIGTFRAPPMGARDSRNPVPGGNMRYWYLTSVATLSAVLWLAGCNRQQTTADANRDGDANRAATTDAQKSRDADIDRLEKRLDDIDRKWADKEKKLEQERAAATKAMRAEVKEDLNSAHQAVENLKTTTPENWWEREERVLEQTTAELERDVKRFTSHRIPPAETNAPVKNTEHDTAFQARRDQFINALQPRVDAMKKDLGKISTKGTEQTERNDTLARVKKLDSDLAELRKASPDDWWKISRDRVSDYIDRLEKSIGRLDDNKSRS
jgi:hypothetical protein